MPQTPNKCNHEDCLRDGPMPNCWSSNQFSGMSIEMAKEDLKKFFLHKRLRDEQEFDGAEEHSHTCEMVALLIRAASLLAASEQREKDAKICKKLEQHGPCGQDGYTQIKREAVNKALKEAQKQILNQDSQNISSNLPQNDD